MILQGSIWLANKGSIGPNLKALEEILQRHVRVFANRAEASVSHARNIQKDLRDEAFLIWGMRMKIFCCTIVPY